MKGKRQGGDLPYHHESHESVGDSQLRRVFTGYACRTDSLMVGYRRNQAIIEPRDEPSRSPPHTLATIDFIGVKGSVIEKTPDL
jgi:hypothetical protein